MKRIRKIQAIILTVCMTLFGLGVTKSVDVHAANVDDTFTVKIKNTPTGSNKKDIDCTFKIIKLAEGNNKSEVQVGNGIFNNPAIDKNTEGTIEIPEEVTDTNNNTYTVTSIGDYAFYQCKEITNTGLDSNNTVTNIGKHAYRGCEKLETTGFENNSTIKSIGDAAFMSCYILESTGLSNKSAVEKIGMSAFWACRNLTDTGLKENTKIKKIDDNTFENCYALVNTGLENNDTIISIGNFAFAGCSGLTSTGLERNTKTTNIGNSVFKKCTSLTKTGLESNTTVTDIGEKAFSECTSLQNVYLPSNSKLSTIGNNAFDGCTSLESFVITGEQVPTFGTNVFTNTPNDFAIYYPLSIENGTVTNIKNGKKIENSYKNGTEITIAADSIEGKTFKNWSLDKGTITFDNSKNTTILTMKEEIVKVTANYEDIEYTITINGKPLDQKHIMNDKVTIVADSIEGKRFKEWQVVSGNVTLADKTKSTTTFTMPAGDVEVKAIYEDIPVINQEGNTTPENGNTGKGNVPEENQKEPSALKIDDKTQSDVVKTEDQTKIEVLMLMVLVFGIGTYMVLKRNKNKE